jgi:hypothetical protein
MKTTKTTDLRITSNPDFSATTVTISAGTLYGCDFLAEHCGRGAVSIEIPKSRLQEVSAAAIRAGLILR